MPQKIVRKVRIKKLPLLVVLLLILVVIGSLIAIFFDYYNDIKNAPPNVGIVGLSSVPKQVSSALPVPSNATESAPIDNTPIKEIQSDTIVPQTIPVDDLYFKDAVFIGDSILKGFKLWASPYPNNVIADQNVGLDQIYGDKDVYYTTATQKTTLWKAVEQKLPNPAKIYVLLGTNGIPGYDNEKHIVYYNDLITKLKAKYPDAIIYIQSVTPITKEVSTKRSPNFTTKKINAFNELILKMAKEQGVYYLQIENVLKDENGYLKSEYDAGDGTHMPKEGHKAVLNYLKNHTVSKEGIAVVKDESAAQPTSEKATE